MQPLTTTTTYTLQWVRPSWRKYQYELRDEATVLATLGISGSMNRATGATAQGECHIQRVGFWRPRILLSDANGGALATYATNWSGTRGELTLTDGTIFHRRQEGFWRTATTWSDAEGQWWSRTTENWKGQMFVELNPAILNRPELGMLLLLSEFLSAVAASETATAAATVVPTS